MLFVYLRVSVHGRNITNASRLNCVRHTNVVRLFESLNQLQHRHSGSGAQVVHFDSQMFALKFRQCGHMTVSQIHDVNVIADSW